MENGSVLVRRLTENAVPSPPILFTLYFDDYFIEVPLIARLGPLLTNLIGIAKLDTLP